MRKLLLSVLLLIVVMAAGLAYYLATPISPVTPSSTPSTTPTTTAIGYPQLKVSEVSPVSFVYVDRMVYWRFKVSGEIDLREKVEINGVYGWWFAIINVTLPNGKITDLYNPSDYVNILRSFNHLSGSWVLDAYVLDVDAWWEKSFLDGEYRVVVWLKGPYGNRSILFDKTFTHRMNYSISITPTKWSSWDEKLRISIVNTGDVPLILQSIGIELSNTGTVIGWIHTPEVLIEPGDSREVEARTEILEDYRAWLKGKTATLDFLISFAGARQLFKVTLSVEFPSK